MKYHRLSCRALLVFTVALSVVLWSFLQVNFNLSPHKNVEAFVFVATDDKYAERALVSAFSLKEVQTSKPIVLICSPSVASVSRFRNQGVFSDVVIRPELTAPQNAQNPNLLLRPSLTRTFTKLNIWTLTSYNKIVYLDSDTLVLRNIDDLFEREELSAASEDLWPDVFNSGVLVVRPSRETFRSLIKRAQSEPSWDGTDQGLLNDVYGEKWRNIPNRRLPYTYNMAYSAFRLYRSAHDRYKDDIRVVHFLGTLEKKPWQYTLNETTNELEPFADIYVKKWWTIYLNFVERKTKKITF
ncbi:glycogenin-1-like [Montipora foliosa]|uniref:glycogenin-1-like n=1 Tax=Montipora foliosa TaxID=591990 RepID=UPI0035F1A863